MHFANEKILKQDIESLRRYIAVFETFKSCHDQVLNKGMSIKYNNYNTIFTYRKTFWSKSLIHQMRERRKVVKFSLKSNHFASFYHLMNKALSSHILRYSWLFTVCVCVCFFTKLSISRTQDYKYGLIQWGSNSLAVMFNKFAVGLKVRCTPHFCLNRER